MKNYIRLSTVRPYTNLPFHTLKIIALLPEKGMNALFLYEYIIHYIKL